MKVFIKVKAVAKKKPLIDTVPMDIDDGIALSNELIACIVRKNVKEFNRKAVDKPIFRYLASDDIADQSQTGKVGFNDKKNEAVQDEEQAVENAITCFSDGIFRLFVGDDEIEYNQPVSLKEGDELTFIRLTMLAGRLW